MGQFYRLKLSGFPMKKIYRESTRTPRQYRRYLFIRNNIYYFRLALTDWQRKLLGRREIRVSLHTPYKKEADKYAQQLHEAIANFLSEKPEPYVDVQGHITEKINSILSRKSEKPVSGIGCFILYRECIRNNEQISF